MGRPTTFAQKVADEVCARLMDGESLRMICEDEQMPGQRTVYQWLMHNDAFAQQYARAREVQADTLADEVLVLADRSRMGHKTTIKANGDTETVEGDMVERTRLQIDARKWLAGKLAPKKYSEKLMNVHTGEDGGPVQVETTVKTDYASLRKSLSNDKAG